MILLNNNRFFVALVPSIFMAQGSHDTRKYDIIRTNGSGASATYQAFVVCYIQVHSVLDPVSRAYQSCGLKFCCIFIIRLRLKA